MTIMRRCEGCGQPIEQELFLEITVRVMKSDGSNQQDHVEQRYGDYCDECAASGVAIQDLVEPLKNYGL